MLTRLRRRRQRRRRRKRRKIWLVAVGGKHKGAVAGDGGGQLVVGDEGGRLVGRDLKTQ